MSLQYEAAANAVMLSQPGHGMIDIWLGAVKGCTQTNLAFPVNVLCSNSLLHPHLLVVQAIATMRPSLGLGPEYRPVCKYQSTFPVEEIALAQHGQKWFWIMH